MIGPKEIKEIVAQYTKHGWTLRRVLLSCELRKNLGDTGRELFATADVAESDFDAAWFSRSSHPGRVTWELRYLGEPAFALDAFMEDGLDADACEEILQDTVDRMRAAKLSHRGN